MRTSEYNSTKRTAVPRTVTASLCLLLLAWVVSISVTGAAVGQKLTISSDANINTYQKEFMSQRVSLEVENKPLIEVVDLLAKEGGVSLNYNPEVVEYDQNLDLTLSQTTMYQALSEVLEDTNLTYAVTESDQLVLLPENEFAVQGGSISGTIVDSETGEELIGANILLTELEEGAVTDQEGEFSLENVPAGTYTMRVSYIGYQTHVEEVQLTEDEDIQVEVALEIGEDQLEEIVVTGYETVTRRELTSSSSSVSTSEIQDLNLQNPESMLQGQVPGVHVQGTSGEPGGQYMVDVRGTASISANAPPLYIVDGVQISFSNTHSSASTSPLNSIAPRDIESIEVLTGAAAASIYGSQASHGVVIIETKRGAEGATEVSVNMEHGFTEATGERPQYIGTEEYLNYLGEARVHEGNDPTVDEGIWTYADFLQGNHGTPDPDSDIPTVRFDDPNSDEYVELAQFDWQDYFMERAPTSKINASVSGGDAGTRFYISGNYEDTDGYLGPESNFRRLGIRTNFDHSISQRVDLGVNINASHTYQFGVCQDGNYVGCPPSQMMFQPPYTFPYLDAEETEYNPNVNLGLDSNPAVRIDDQDRYANTYHIIARPELNVQVTDWLGLGTSIGLDFRNAQDYRYDGVIAAPGDQGRVSERNRNNLNYTTDFTANYNPDLGETHSISGVVGTEYRYEHGNLFRARGIGLPGGFFQEINATAESDITSGSSSEWEMLSFFTTTRYNYDETYFLTFTQRYDGSSRFGADHRWGYFPSLSAAWDVAQEDFFDVEAINALRFRAAYGIVGNQSGVGRFTARDLWGVEGSYQGQTGIRPEQLGNAELTWEETHEIELGTDFELFQGRIGGTINAYRRDTDGLLFSNPLPGESGFGSVTDNIGKLRNQGLEFELTTVNVQTQNFSWSSRMNLSIPRNEVLRLPEEDAPALNEHSYANEIREGESLGQLRGPEIAGVNPADGRPFWYDADGNLTYTPVQSEDNVLWQTGRPDYRGGVSNTLTYGGFSVRAHLDINVGQWAHAHTDWVFTNHVNNRMQLKEGQVGARWQEPGDITHYPRAATGGNNYEETVNHRNTRHTGAFQNASYVRLQELTLSYNLPVQLTEAIGMRNVRIYGTGTNLWTDTAWPYYDPEVAWSSTDIYQNRTQASYPIGSTFTVGIDVDI